MNILLVGSGARECALSVENLKVRAFDGTLCLAWQCDMMSLKYGKETGLDRTATQEQILAWALENNIQATICGPEQPLTEKFADNFQAKGSGLWACCRISCFGGL